MDPLPRPLTLLSLRQRLQQPPQQPWPLFDCLPTAATVQAGGTKRRTAAPQLQPQKRDVTTDLWFKTQLRQRFLILQDWEQLLLKAALQIASKRLLL